MTRTVPGRGPGPLRLAVGIFLGLLLATPTRHPLCIFPSPLLWQGRLAVGRFVGLCEWLVAKRLAAVLSGSAVTQPPGPTAGGMARAQPRPRPSFIVLHAAAAAALFIVVHAAAAAAAL